MHMLAGVGEDQKVGPVADFHLEPFAQQMVKEIVGFGKTRPKIAEIQANFHFLFKAPGGGPAVKLAHDNKSA